MIKTNIEFKKGILFLRLKGSLLKSESKELEEQIFPILLKGGFKYVVLNLDELNNIDSNGINFFDELYKITKSNNGRISLCNIKNDDVKYNIETSYINDLYYKTDNELTSLEVFKI